MTDTAHATAVADLLAWFDREGRDWPWRRTRDRWQILVAEVCLQQTQVARAAEKIEQILERFPTAEVLAAAPLGELLQLWQGLGYPRRARNLWLSAQHIADHGWPDDYRMLPGVGDYTSAALRCFADEEPVVPPDINTRRVFQRLFPAGPPTVDSVPAVSEQPWHWGQAVMELGQRICKARALCDECPVAEHCPSRCTMEVVASPRQARYAGSMRQRRGKLLKLLAVDGTADATLDSEAAQSLVADGLVGISADGALLHSL
jgi:A/G-specific adenine glycosylase